MRIAYFDCFSGISGDMTLGALVDLGVPEAVLTDAIATLPVSDYSIRFAKERRGAITGTRVLIEYGDQPHRHYSDIREMIEASRIEPQAKTMALRIFDRIADAESRVHGVPVSHVHFHEVGAIDSIIDIVGAAVCLCHLKVEKICASRLPMGGGMVKTQHGLLPVPAPATVLLLEGIPVYDNGVRRELVTPTGAAILGALADSFGTVPDMTVGKVGHGVGTNPSTDPPNVLRVMLGTTRPAYSERGLLLLETNIDDMNPEIYDYVMERLFAAGVRDVSLSPAQMKKNRPGVLLRALFDPALQPAVLDVIFRETSTLGVRLQEVRRIELPRREATVDTPFGPTRVKMVTGPDGKERLVPEYDECLRIARETRLPMSEVYRKIAEAAK